MVTSVYDTLGYKITSNRRQPVPFDRSYDPLVILLEDYDAWQLESAVLMGT